MGHKSLWVSDIHVSNTLPYAKRLGDSPITDRLMDTINVLEEVRQYAIEHGIKDVWLPGDLLDRRLIDAVTLDAAIDEIDKFHQSGIHLRLIPGNHEAFDQAASTYTLVAFAGIWPSVEVLDETAIVDVGGWRFRVLPYKPDDVAREAINAIREQESKTKQPVCLVIHQSIVGGKMGGYPNEHGLTDADFVGFKAVISGHFHTPQTVGAARYLGAPLQHTFGDSGEARGFWEMDFGPKNVTARFIESSAPRFHIAEWSHETDLVGEFEVHPGDYVLINVKGTPAQISAASDRIAKAIKSYVEQGARLAKPNPQPEATAKERAAVAEKGTGKVSWPVAIVGYVDAHDLSGLDRTKLLRVAKEAMEEAE